MLISPMLAEYYFTIFIAFTLLLYFNLLIFNRFYFIIILNISVNDLACVFAQLMLTSGFQNSIRGDNMSATEFLYLIKTIEDNKVQLVTKIDVVDGVVMSEGRICAVLKRYTPPVDMSEALADIQKFSASVPTVVKQLGRKTSGKVYKDHLGNEFETVFQMCAYYKISESKYRSRMANGWSQEEALTGVRKKKQIADHLGNIFDSKTDMCQFYGIRESLFNARLNAGKTLEEALVGIEEESKFTIEDHLGNKYKNVSQMCKAYGVRLDSYCQRKKRGWSLEEILTGKKKSEPVIDHKGVSYPDIEEMCLEYGVQKTTYLSRINKGWTIEEALTGVRKDSVVYDHLGNMYLTQKEMCERYGIKLGTFRARMKSGLTLEAALTTDIGEPGSSGKTVSDHVGNTYQSIKEMCAAYAVNTSTYQCRIRNGYTVEEALTGNREKVVQLKPPKVPTNKVDQPAKKVAPPKKPKDSVTDHLGNEYGSILEMCQAYGIRVDTFKYRLKHGSSLEDALTRTPSMVTTNIPCQDHLGNQYISQTEMARAYGLTKEQFIARKRNGWDIKRILTTPISSGRSGSSFVHDGVTYSSKKDFCEKNGLNYDVFIHRTNAGMSIEEAFAAGLGVKSTRRASVMDHKGNTFPTMKEMCSSYGVSVGTYKYRLKQGWDLEAALTKPSGSGIPPKKVVDHNGTQFDSVTEMCNTYGLRVATYKYRLNHGCDMEQALTTPLNSESVAPPKEKVYLHFDHKGNGYHSKAEMCKAYGISLYTFKKRQFEGLSLQDTLELPVTREHHFTFKDHTGVEYESLKEMCAAWNVSVHTYQKRISKGYSIERALTEPDDSVAIVDHKGNKYSTIQSMCAAYGVSLSLYTSRIKRGKSIAEALETPIEDNSVEYDGKTFLSLKDLAKEYNINAGTLRSRMKLGWSLEEAVTGIKKSKACYDHLGKEYKSQKEMCQAYGVGSSTYHGRIKNGWSVEKALLGK